MSQQVLELILSSAEEGIEDNAGDKKIIWKDILREGDFAITPGRKQQVPFRVVPTGKSSAPDRVISMADVMKSFEDKAFESVTIPLRHPQAGDANDVLNNSGYVESLRVVKKGDKHYLQAGLGFTEPDIAEKVRRGTIPNVSSGILFDWVRKSDAKVFPAALNHVCLTKQPWINDLEPFKRVYASDEAVPDEIEIEIIELQDEEGDGGDAKIVWNEQTSYQWVRSSVQAALAPESAPEGLPRMPQPEYAVIDISRDDTALVEEWFRGDRKRWVIPFELGDNKVSVAPAMRWVEVREAMVAASDDFEAKTYSKLLEKLSAQLSDSLGEVGKSLRIEEVSTDGRVRVKNTENNAVFLAEFMEFDDVVLLSAASDWELLYAPHQADAEQPAPAPVKKVVELFDMNTPEGRVAAARQRRRQMMSRSH